MCVFLDFFRGFELMCEFYPIERMQRIWARDTYPVGSSGYPLRGEERDKTICGKQSVREKSPTAIEGSVAVFF